MQKLSEYESRINQLTLEISQKDIEILKLSQS